MQPPLLSPHGERAIRELVKLLFKDDDGKPFILTSGQCNLFAAIFVKPHSRIQLECFTQYGKSEVVAMAILLSAAVEPGRIVVLGGSKGKAFIIVQKVIKHIFENPLTFGRFRIDPGDSLERIKRERSRERVTFRVDDAGNLGEIFLLSAEARRVGDKAGDILIGHGAPTLIEDDAALIEDNIHGKAIRMLGGSEGFLCKISNSLGRNHFYRSSLDKSFWVYKIDWRQGLLEGRMTEKRIEECRNEMDPSLFASMYDCAFPEEGAVEPGGWQKLLTETDIELSQRRFADPYGTKYCGADVGERVNPSLFAVRQGNFAEVGERFTGMNPTFTANKLAEFIGKAHILPENTFVDATALGSGTVSDLHQKKIFVNGIKAGESPKEKKPHEQLKDPVEFKNQKAKMFWALRQWVREGGFLKPDPDWKQLSKIRWRINNERKIEIMSKETMRRHGYISATGSTDAADALALTFADRKVIKMFSEASSGVLPYYPELGF